MTSLSNSAQSFHDDSPKFSVDDFEGNVCCICFDYLDMFSYNDKIR